MKLVTASECRKIAEDFMKRSPLYERMSDELMNSASMGNLSTVLYFNSIEERELAKKCLYILDFGFIGHGTIGAIEPGEKDIYTLEVTWK